MPRCPPWVGVCRTKLIATAHLERQQVRDLLDHRGAVDLELRPHVALADLAREALDVVAVVREEDLLVADEEVEQPMFSEHISGARRTVVIRSSTLSRGLPPVVSWMIASVRAQPVVQLGVDRRVHRVRPVGGLRACTWSTAAPAFHAAMPCSTISSGCSGSAGWPPCRDPARQRTGDDDRVGARPPGHSGRGGHHRRRPVDHRRRLDHVLVHPQLLRVQPQGEPDELGKVEHRHVQRAADDAGGERAAGGPG